MNNNKIKAICGAKYNLYDSNFNWEYCDTVFADILNNYSVEQFDIFYNTFKDKLLNNELTVVKKFLVALSTYLIQNKCENYQIMENYMFDIITSKHKIYKYPYKYFNDLLFPSIANHDLDMINFFEYNAYLYYTDINHCDNFVSSLFLLILNNITDKTEQHNVKLRLLSYIRSSKDFLNYLMSFNKHTVYYNTYEDRSKFALINEENNNIYPVIQEPFILTEELINDFDYMSMEAKEGLVMKFCCNYVYEQDLIQYTKKNNIPSYNEIYYGLVDSNFIKRLLDLKLPIRYNNIKYQIYVNKESLEIFYGDRYYDFNKDIRINKEKFITEYCPTETFKLLKTHYSYIRL